MTTSDELQRRKTRDTGIGTRGCLQKSGDVGIINTSGSCSRRVNANIPTPMTREGDGRGIERLGHLHHGLDVSVNQQDGRLRSRPREKFDCWRIQEETWSERRAGDELPRQGEQASPLRSSNGGECNNTRMSPAKRNDATDNILSQGER